MVPSLNVPVNIISPPDFNFSELAESPTVMDPALPVPNIGAVVFPPWLALIYVNLLTSLPEKTVTPYKSV